MAFSLVPYSSSALSAVSTLAISISTCAVLPTVTRNKVQLQRITDDESRQAMFARRKQGLVKKAMELSVLCDCDVGLIVFGPGSSGPGTGGQRLYQYSSVSMDELLERYAAAVSEPHERRRTGELLRHYYELSPDEDGLEEGDHRAGPGAPCTSAAAAEAAAMMAAVDSVILGGGGSGRRQDSSGGGMKRMRSISPLGLGGPGMAGGMAGGLGGGIGLAAGNGVPFVQHHPSMGAAGMAPLRRLPVVGAGSLGPPLPLEGIKAAGFLDKQKYPVSPRSERAYEAVTTQLDKLTELRGQRGVAGGSQAPTVLQPLASSAAVSAPLSLAAQQHLQLQQFLQRQQQQQQQQLLLQQPNHHQPQGFGAKRFKPLSIMVPEIPAQPIIPTHLAPHTAAPTVTPGPAPPSSSAAPSTTAANGSLTQYHPQHAPQQGGLPPPRPLNGRSIPVSLNNAINPSHLQQTNQSQQPGVGPAATAAAGGHPSGSTANGGMGTSGAAPMDVDGSGAATAAGDDSLSVLLGSGSASSASGGATLPPFRSSTDGSAANLLNMPSPPPLGGAAALFGSLDGGPLSIRSSSHGMLTALGMERGTSLGLGLESPGGLDAALRGLGPMDVLDWPSASPRSSSGVTEPSGAGGPGEFPDETEADGEAGTVMDGLVVTGTSLAKLAPEALVAAIGPTLDGNAAGTSVSARGRGGVASTSTSPSAFASPLTQQRLVKGLIDGQEAGHMSAQQPGQATQPPSSPAVSGSLIAGGEARGQDGDASGRGGAAGGRYGLPSVGASGALTVELSFNELGSSAEPSVPGCIAAGT